MPEARKAQGFPKSIRLRKEADFIELTRKGRRRKGKFVTAVILDTPKGVQGGKNAEVRLAVVVSKRIGNAVVRNRWKRKIRAIFRCLSKSHPIFAGARDIMIMAKQPGCAPGQAELKDEILHLLT